MNLNEYLLSLGSSSEEVALSLIKQNVKGICHSLNKCPVINGIYKAIPTYNKGLQVVDGHKIISTWYYTASFGDNQIESPIFPQAVMDFMGDFDMGKYPDLEIKAIYP